MAIDRREILTGAALTFGSALWPSLVSGAFADSGVESTDELLIAACRRSDGRFALVVLTPTGRIVRQLPLQGRGHDFAFHRMTGAVVAFARRPGRFALSFNTRDNRPPTLFAPPVARHFYGHGTFSNDGRLLYATENDFDNARGVIGIYDAANGFARIGEFPSHGVGPHDMLLLSDGKTLVVANGGIETHPESGREKLNIATMKPSLCFIDIETGDLKTRHDVSPSLHQLSIRHLAGDGNGNVWFGGQWQGAGDRVPGLIGRARMDAPLQLVEGLESHGARLKGYIGSVAMSADGRWLAASAPRAGRIVYFDTKNPGKLRMKPVADGCGLAPAGRSQFVVSSGRGVFWRWSPTKDWKNSNSFPELAFDNHMRAIS